MLSDDADRPSKWDLTTVTEFLSKRYSTEPHEEDKKKAIGPYLQTFSIGIEHVVDLSLATFLGNVTFQGFLDGYLEKGFSELREKEEKSGLDYKIGYEAGCQARLNTH